MQKRSFRTKRSKRSYSFKSFQNSFTAEEKLLVENLGKVTEIFKELYKVKSNLKVVNAAIFSKRYTDQSVFLKDLVYPSSGRLPDFDRFTTLTRKWNVSLNDFAANFWIEVDKKNDPAFKKFLSNLGNSNTSQSRTSTNNRTSEMGDGVTVYSPYYEEFIPTDDPGGGGGGGYYEPITSIVTATADADQGWGSQPYYLNGVFQYYVQVLVDDEYAFANPTQIIGVNGIEIETAPTEAPPPPPPPPPPGVSRVYVGEGLCKNNYDRLISFTGNGGGSEIKYCHLTGYLQPVNGHVTTFQDIVSVDFSRGSIRREEWKRNYTVWDDDWVPTDLEQIFAIYEEDNTNTITFTGALGTSLTVAPGSTVTASIGFSVTKQSQDDIIRQLKISRNSYFAGSFQDQGWGFSNDATFLPLPFTHGWPKYDGNRTAGANVCWTWPYSTF